MKKVLIITYYCPPRPPLFAGRHAAALAKYLPEFNWQPCIITAALPNKPDTQFQIVETPYHDSLKFFKRLLGIKSDERLLLYVAELKKKFGITSEKSFLDSILKLAGELLAYPDPQKGWRSSAINVGNEFLNSEHVDAILSISPPVTSHIIAAELKRRHGIPWGAYSLDLWTQNHFYPYSRFRRALERRLELRTLSSSDVLATVSQPLADKLGQLHEGKQVETIMLGFEPDEFLESPSKLSPKFTITYTGNIYPGKQSPEPLFRALNELISEQAINPDDLEVRFYGPELGWMKRQIVTYHLEATVKQFGMVPREIAIEKQRDSQLLLLFGWLDPNQLGIYTAKVFEYLAACRPILAVGVSKGDVLPSLLEETKSGVHCSTVDEIKDFITQSYQEYKTQGHVSYRGDKKEVMKYSYSQMALKFSQLLSRLAPPSGQDTER